MLNVVDDARVVHSNLVDVVRGSLVVSPDRRQVTYIQTGGLLAADTYTVTLTSGADAWCDATGQPLDGNADGVVTAGDDYVTTMVVEAPASNAITVSLPDFARGYGQPVNLPADDLTAGMPLTMSEAVGVSGLDLHLYYDPSLVEISGFTLNSSIHEAQVGLTWPEPGMLILAVSSAVSFADTAGPLTLGAFTTRVLDDAPYAAKQVLDIRDLHIYDDAADPQELPSIADDAIHVAAYFGDTNGSGHYNPPDATLVQRLIGQPFAPELITFQQVDPRLLADINLNEKLQATDASLLLQAIGQDPVTNIPSLPTGLDPPVASGLDPQIYIPRDLRGRPGDIVSVPVRINVTEAEGITLSGLDLVISFDASRFSVANPQLGDLLAGAGFSGMLFEPESGYLIYTASSATGTSLLPYGTTGNLLTLSFTVLANAALGSAAINLRSSLGYTSTALFDNDLQELTLVPAPTDGVDEGIDGLFTVQSDAQIAGQRLFYNNSVFDGRTPGSDPNDDQAIAPDKQVLLPGQTATFANYTSYDKGINGLMVDVHNLLGTPSANDFVFRVGNDDLPYGSDPNNSADDWPLAPAPLEIAMREGAGLDGSDLSLIHI